MRRDLSFSLAKESPIPAQTTPYPDQTTGAALDLKEKATGQFEKIADKATNTFRDVADRLSSSRPKSRREVSRGCRQREECRSAGSAAATPPLRRASMVGTRFQLLCMDGQ